MRVKVLQVCDLTDRSKIETLTIIANLYKYENRNQLYLFSAKRWWN